MLNSRRSRIHDETKWRNEIVAPAIHRNGSLLIGKSDTWNRLSEKRLSSYILHVQIGDKNLLKIKQKTVKI